MQNLERGEKRMFRIAICDDEKIFRDDLKEILIRYMTDRGIMLEIDTFSSGKEFVELGIEMVKYKIVFLDINMDELDGIMTAKKDPGKQQGYVYCFCYSLCKLYDRRI